MTLTLAILKPECFESADIVPRILERIFYEGFKIGKFSYEVAEPAKVRAHYAAHKGAEYYDRLVEGIAGKNVVVMSLVAENAVERWRSVMGTYKEAERDPDTLRGELMPKGQPTHLNFLHGSDSDKSAMEEMYIWFGV